MLERGADRERRVMFDRKSLPTAPVREHQYFVEHSAVRYDFLSSRSHLRIFAMRLPIWTTLRPSD
jgi:hypothetical protein